MKDWGFRAVISPRFGDIFRNNALKEGLLPVELPMATVEWLWDRLEAEPHTQVTVDLVERQVRLADQVWDFPLDDFSRWRLMEGLDDIGLTLRHEAAITAYEQSRPSFTPVITP